MVTLEEKFLKARSVELQAVRRAEEAAEDARKAQRQRASAAAECTELRATVAALQAGFRAVSLPCRSRARVFWSR